MTRFASSRKLAVIALFVVVEAMARAHAADLPVAITDNSPLPVFSWTGCYAGVEGGDAAGSSNQVAQSGSFAGQTITGNFRMTGGLVGGTVGCNYQTSQWVFGIENDLSAINTRGTVSDIAPFNPNATSTTRETWLDTLRGRIGYSWGRTLVYGTGGLALAGAGVNVCAPAGCVNDSKTVAGVALGVGLEQSFWNSWSIKLELLAVGFGSPRFVNTPVFPGPGGGTVVTRDARLDDGILRVGVNYRFY